MNDHDREPHDSSNANRLNRLRAGVLGANDGIVSVASILIGVAGATAQRGTVINAGTAGLVAGAISMALGEYVSVSSQRDSERAQIAMEKRELQESPNDELAELASMYEAKGLSVGTARTVAEELTAHDALRAHLDTELHLDAEDLTSPGAAALSSAVSFVLGALLPLLALILAPHDARFPVLVAVTVVALGITGAVAARLGGAPVRPALLRVVIGGSLGLAASFFIGRLLGATVA